MKYINYIIQFLFIRIARCEQKDVCVGVSVGYTNNQFLTNESSMFPMYQDQYWYAIQYWIMPLTGWLTSFSYVGGKPKFWRITKKRCLHAMWPMRFDHQERYVKKECRFCDFITMGDI